MSSLVSYRDFKAELIKVTGTKPNDSMTSLFLKKFKLQTPWIKLSNYGIPKLSKYTDTELKRACIKVPLDETYFNNHVFIERLIDIDNLLNSEGFRKEFLGSKYKAYKYNDLVKDDERMRYTKFKLDVETDKIDIKIRTQIIKVTDDVKELVNCKSVDDVMKILKYNCKFRMMIEPVKVWVMKSTKSYGLTFKALMIEVKDEPKPKLDFIDD